MPVFMANEEQMYIFQIDEFIKSTKIYTSSTGVKCPHSKSGAQFVHVTTICVGATWRLEAWRGFAAACRGAHVDEAEGTPGQRLPAAWTAGHLEEHRAGQS